MNLGWYEWLMGRVLVWGVALVVKVIPVWFGEVTVTQPELLAVVVETEQVPSPGMSELQGYGAVLGERIGEVVKNQEIEVEEVEVAAEVNEKESAETGNEGVQLIEQQPAVTSVQVEDEVDITPTSTLRVEPMVEIMPTQTLSTEADDRVKISDSLQEYVNVYRQEHDRSVLVEKDSLCATATKRLAEIKISFSHDGFDGQIGKLDYEAIAENIGFCEPFELEKIITGWDRSTGHRENLLGEWTYGCGASGDGYAVYLFMR